MDFGGGIDRGSEAAGNPGAQSQYRGIKGAGREGGFGSRVGRAGTALVGNDAVVVDGAGRQNVAGLVAGVGRSQRFVLDHAQRAGGAGAVGFYLGFTRAPVNSLGSPASSRSPGDRRAPGVVPGDGDGAGGGGGTEGFTWGDL